MDDETRDRLQRIEELLERTNARLDRCETKLRGVQARLDGGEDTTDTIVAQIRLQSANGKMAMEYGKAAVETAQRAMEAFGMVKQQLARLEEDKPASRGSGTP